MSAGGLLIEREGQRLLIDVGVGPLVSDFVYGSIDCGSLLDVLAALGRRPEDIDVVAFTHLHFDHAGWASGTNVDTRVAPDIPERPLRVVGTGVGALRQRS